MGFTRGVFYLFVVAVVMTVAALVYESNTHVFMLNLASSVTIGACYSANKRLDAEPLCMYAPLSAIELRI